MGHQQRRWMKPWGLHGVGHWWRVRFNGLLVAAKTGADERVVRLFSLFHDAFREDDGHDECTVCVCGGLAARGEIGRRTRGRPGVRRVARRDRLAG